jgi:hypothetical protein
VEKRYRKLTGGVGGDEGASNMFRSLKEKKE